MYAESINSKWRELQTAAHSTWQKATGVHDARNSDAAQVAYGSLAAPDLRSNFMPRITGGLLMLVAIVALTYAGAATLVSGAASHSNARNDHALALQRASADYRRARAECMRGAVAGRDACIADAHAAEDRARAVAALSPSSYFVSLRSRTDAAIDAGDRDGIVIEPACMVVSRGQAGVCEIQGGGNALAQSKSDQSVTQAQADIKSTATQPIVKTRTSVLPSPNRDVLQIRTSADTRRNETVLFNVAAVTH